VAAGDLASYCLHALAAASSLASPAAVHRLVGVTPSRSPARAIGGRTGRTAQSPARLVVQLCQ
jgi:hypothetical protein